MAKNITSWQKGFCPNPGGRTVGLKEIRNKALSITIKGLDLLEAIVTNENETTKNRLTALGMALDRAIGKPTQMISTEEESDPIHPSRMTSNQLKHYMEVALHNRAEDTLKIYLETGDPEQIVSLIGNNLEKVLKALNETGRLQPILRNLAFIRQSNSLANKEETS